MYLRCVLETRVPEMDHIDGDGSKKATVPKCGYQDLKIMEVT